MKQEEKQEKLYYTRKYIKKLDKKKLKGFHLLGSLFFYQSVGGFIYVNFI